MIVSLSSFSLLHSLVGNICLPDGIKLLSNKQLSKGWLIYFKVLTSQSSSLPREDAKDMA